LDLSLETWNDLSGVGCLPGAGCGCVGCHEGAGCCGEVGVVSNDEFVEHHARVIMLNADVAKFNRTATPEKLGAAASFMGQWIAYMGEWEAWRQMHLGGLSRIWGSTEAEFGSFRARYNVLRSDFLALGGTTAVQVSETERPPEVDAEGKPVPDALDKLTAIMKPLAVIAVIGAAVYFLGPFVPLLAGLLPSPKKREAA
jgi:hypothetical protein